MDYKPCWWKAEASIMTALLGKMLNSESFGLSLFPVVQTQLEKFFLEVEESIKYKAIIPRGAHLLALKAIGAIALDCTWTGEISLEESDEVLLRLSKTFKGLEGFSRPYSRSDVTDLFALGYFFANLCIVEDVSAGASVLGFSAPESYITVH